MKRISGLGFRQHLDIRENDFCVGEGGEYSPKQGYLFMRQQQQRLLDIFSSKR